MEVYVFWDTIQSIEGGRSNTIKRGKTISFLIFINLEKRIRIKKGCKYNKLKFTNPTQKGKFWSYCVYVSFWRHGRVVRRGTANPFSPVQIRVPPHQQTNQNLLSANINHLITANAMSTDWVLNFIGIASAN